MAEPAEAIGGAPPAPSRRLLNATAVMASGTMLSRALGFIKALLLVVVLGASTPQADAYSLATLVPNTLYMIFAGGALNTVLVPQLVRHLKNDDDGGEAFTQRIMTAFLALLGLVTLAATAATPLVMSVWTSDTWRTPEMAGHWHQLVLLAFLTMPQLFFFGAFFLIGQVLNARDKFGPMMWAPILNNLVGMAVLGLYVAIWGTNVSHSVPFTNAQVLLLGLGSSLGIIAQTLALIPFMRSVGFRYRPRWDLRGQGLGETFHLAKWMLGYVLLTSAAQAIVSRLASGATVAVEGQSGAGVAAYNTAYLVWILPHSLLTVSLATAMLPSASRLAAAHDLPGVAAETTRTMRLAATFLVPSSIAFLVLGLPFSRVAFGHGAGANDWMLIGWTLMCFAVGLVPYTVQYVYLRGFYALEDTRTPFILQIVISGANVLLAIALITASSNPLTVAPRLALAYSLSYLLGAVITHRSLRKRLTALSGVGLVGHLSRLFWAVAPGALLAALLIWWFGRSDRLLQTFLVLVLAVALAALSFFFFAKRMRLEEATQLLALLRRRPAAPPASDAEDPAPHEDLDADDVALATAAGDERPLLAYPDPADGDRTPLTRIPAGEAPIGHVVAGQILDDRYRLDEILMRRGSTLTWRAWDLTLSRPVLLHVMHPDEPRALEILDQARQAAPAVDARYLRVWDAVLVEGEPHGSYIVCEYAPGQSLQLVLRNGPLPDIEAAWVVRELASGLVAMHSQGLYHRQLNPDTVVLTASGNVKMVGFLVENALHQAPQDTEGEPSDVRALGELLYSCLVARWPGPARFGLRAAPTDHAGRPLLPRQVSATVPVALSDIVDRILSPTPRGGASRLATAEEIVAALDVVLRGADASRSLGERLRHLISPIRITAPKPSTAAPDATAAVQAPVPPAPVPPAPVPPASVPPASVPPGSEPVPDAASTSSSPPTSLQGRPDAVPALPFDHPDDSPSAQASSPTESFWVTDSPATAPFTPIPPPQSRQSPPAIAPAPPPQPRRGWILVLAGLFLLVLVVSLLTVFTSAVQRRSAAEPTAWPLVAVRDFDPASAGGDNSENPDLAAYAIDGDTTTAWRTESYGRSATFNDRKPGAGLVVDLGEARSVGAVTVLFGPGVTSGQLRVPADATAAEPPMDDLDAWRVIGTIEPSSGAVRVAVDPQVTTRFVLVFLTSLPADGANYVGTIHEIGVYE